jgi:hypothetical protein
MIDEISSCHMCGRSTIAPSVYQGLAESLCATFAGGHRRGAFERSRSSA